MNDAVLFLVRHGPLLLFAMVFVEQIGLPIPAAPVLAAAGALIATSQMNWAGALLAACLGSVLADLLWFQLGRRRGARILSLLCRVSLEPDSCIHRTDATFSRYGLPVILGAKFVPGLGLVMPPLAAMAGISFRRFLAFDALGSLLYSGSYLALGVVFNQQLVPVLNALAGVGRSAVAFLLGLLAIYIGFKYLKRRRRLQELSVARMTGEELRQKQQAAEPVFIVDLRSAVELRNDPVRIPGARHLQAAKVASQLDWLPAKGDVVLYCSCPNEVASARAALSLRKRGFTRAWPLAGGLDTWRQRNYPLEAMEELGARSQEPGVRTRAESDARVKAGAAAVGDSESLRGTPSESFSA